MIVENLSTKELAEVFDNMQTLVEGYAPLENIDNAIAIFGSARTKEDSSHYSAAKQVAKHLAQAGYSIITGGGPGIMQAANHGAKEGNGLSIGLHIYLPNEQNDNTFLDINIAFNNLFTRKLVFAKHSRAYVIMPGGMGTIDEFSEAMVLIQTNLLNSSPLIFYNSSYWKGLIDWLQDSMLKEGYISPHELNMLHLVDSPDEVEAIIKNFGK